MTSPIPAPQAHSSTFAHLHVSVLTVTRFCLPVPVMGVPQVTDSSLLIEGKGKLVLPIQPLHMTTHSLTEEPYRRKPGAQGTHPGS